LKQEIEKKRQLWEEAKEKQYKIAMQRYEKKTKTTKLDSKWLEEKNNKSNVDS